jgi:6-pyruvoyltetrahydropterin/6-carboxytetrahydropterin synthase
MSFFKLSQSFYFESAHTLNRNYEKNSNRIHGHTYVANISIKGFPNESGMIVDLAILKQKCQEIKEILDHQFLDNVSNLGNPTIENLCLFIANYCKELPIYEVSVERNIAGDKCVYVFN